ncbi:MAG TPA: hypothetical protein PK414_05200 [Anaerolineales bacterium]|nr:hypothetical protein [Anaerolineales bacterium]
MPLDINLSPLYRINGQEQAEMPGVLALDPPKQPARGREQDRLVVYLLLTGNSTFTLTEYRKLAEDTANIFFQTPRAVTSALRASADFVNKTLLDRNMSTSSRGQYALAWLSLAAIREGQCIFSLSGPMHAYLFSRNNSRHFFEPAVTGKGLGSSQTLNIHYAQADLSAGDHMLFCGRVPNAWASSLEDVKPSSFDAIRRRLYTLTNEDLNAILVHASDGPGVIHFYKGNNPLKVEMPKVVEVPEEQSPPPPTPNLPADQEAESTPAHVLQPATYTTTASDVEIEEPVIENTPLAQPTPTGPLASLPHQTTPRDFPASIPRAQPKPQTLPIEEVVEEIKEEPEPALEQAPQVQLPESQPAVLEDKVKRPTGPREPSPAARQTAKAIVSFMQGFRRTTQGMNEKLKGFLPRLLPDSEASAAFAPSDFSMFVIAVTIPLVIVTILFVVYSKYGRNPQFESYIQQAQQVSQQAPTLATPIEQREAWDQVIDLVAKAEEIYRSTSESIQLREEAEANRDKLFGITRMQFNPAFSSNLGIQISRMAASEKDIYLLNAENGDVLRAFPSGSGGFELDTTFICKQGVYGNYTVGPLVDILALPVMNFINASLLGIDANGNLLYCAPGQVPQAIPLPPPDTNWGHINAFMLDNGTLYVLDAQSRAVWVYNGKDGTYTDRPYFFFGQQTPTQDVIDFVISGDEMYLLHGDGRLSNCSYSRIDSNTSKCQDPVPLVNTFPAYQDMDLFGSAHFTQILFAAPPDPSILLLDADGQSLMRFAPRTLELQNQIRPRTGSGNLVPSGTIGAVAVSPDHILYLAVGGQVYFAVNMP